MNNYKPTSKLRNTLPRVGRREIIRFPLDDDRDGVVWRHRNNPDVITGINIVKHNYKYISGEYYIDNIQQMTDILRNKFGVSVNDFIAAYTEHERKRRT